MRKRILFTVAAAPLVALLCAPCGFNAMVGDLTVADMQYVKDSIVDYANTHHRLPATLAEACRNKAGMLDDWKREIAYSYDRAGVVTLYSLGEDNRRGGEGLNRDIVGVFETRDRHGAWRPKPGWKIPPHS